MTHPTPVETAPRFALRLLALLAVAAAAGCQGVTGLSLLGTDNDGGSGGGGIVVGGGGSPDAGGGGSRDAGGGAGSGGASDGGVVVDVPCDVYTVLSTYCWTCHGPTPTNGAPQALVTLAQLQAPSPSYAAQSNGERAVVRMADTGSPMPPAGNPVPSAAEQATFAAWVDAGMPTGSCATDAGLPDAGPPDPLNAAPTCTSGQSYTSGQSSTMEPGLACISCHQSNGGPHFSVAGTVFPTGHEPDKCNAPASSGAVVTVTDSTGASASFTANSVGNFSGSASLTFPITAVVSFDGKTRAMTTAVASGDCNSCHTQSGANGAPGRVTLPP
jgi:mono/diheme cytochrome c family protein